MKTAKRTITATIAALAMLAAGGTWAGDLNPTNGPAPTMHTLDEIYDLIAETRQDVLVNRQLLEDLGATTNIPTGFNINFRSAETNLTFGAASGQTGTWAHASVGTTAGLTNAAGEATDASITLTGANDTYNPVTGPMGAMLRRSVTHDFMGDDFSASITGLEDGQYDVYYYFHSATAGMTANGTAMDDLAGGDPDALGSEGSNWDVVAVTVTDGTLTISDSSAASDGLSGIQIVPK